MLSQSYLANRERAKFAKGPRHAINGSYLNASSTLGARSNSHDAGASLIYR